MLRTALVAIALLFAAPALAQTRPTVNAPPIIDGPALVGSAPAEGSVRAAADRLSMRQEASAERLAQAHADIPWSPWTALHPVFGDSFTEANLPRTARVFADVVAAISPPIGAAKNQYLRRRPFLDMSNVVQCDPPDQTLAASGSFPSGHAAGGWAWALVMAELVPGRADAILQRGRDYGDSRVICGYHYPSDIESGRLLAAGVIARLHADPQFRRHMDEARRELARAYPN